jgi:hypothetical protein
MVLQHLWLTQKEVVVGITHSLSQVHHQDFQIKILLVLKELYSLIVRSAESVGLKERVERG